ncbi:MAG: hypothetical protein R3D33_16355 [Hyphomicrobiaceae bacterium]
MIFPSFSPGCETEIERATPEWAFAQLVGTGSSPAGKAPSIRPLARLCNDIPAFRLAYGSLAEAIGATRAILAEVAVRTASAPPCEFHD